MRALGWIVCPVGSGGVFERHVAAWGGTGGEVGLVTVTEHDYL